METSRYVETTKKNFQIMLWLSRLYSKLVRNTVQDRDSISLYFWWIVSDTEMQ